MSDAGFWTVNLGNVLTILALGVAMLGFVYTLRGRVDALADRMIAMETQVAKLVEVLVQQGRQDERLRTIDDRVLAQGQRLDDLAKRLNSYVDKQR